MELVNAELRHPDSPTAPEPLDPRSMLAALRAALPPGYSPRGEQVGVDLELDVDQTGRVTRVTAAASEDIHFRDAALAAVAASTFRPATRDGVAVSVSALRVRMAFPATALRPRPT
jgi:outer membrane biosynthesis protein TonB